MHDVLQLIGRDQALFEADLARHEVELSERVANGRFLVIGGAGSIGQAVAREIFKRRPRALHVVDISENNLVDSCAISAAPWATLRGTFAPLLSTAARWSLAPCCAGRGAMIMC